MNKPLTILHPFFHLIELLVSKSQFFINANMLKNHLIFSDRSRLIRKNVFHSSQLFRTVGVPHNSPPHQFVPADLKRVEKFSEIQVDPHRDGDDGAQEHDHAHELHRNIGKLGSLEEQKHTHQYDHD
jgi:hypothetical protein